MAWIKRMLNRLLRGKLPIPGVYAIERPDERIKEYAVLCFVGAEAKDVVFMPDIPRLGSKHPRKHTYCARITASPIESDSKSWKVLCEYEPAL